MNTGSSAGLAVIGLGLIGAAAVRHLAAAGADVVGIGPPEPPDWATHDGVFASHYDSGRITRVLDSRYEWAELARRSIEAYPLLEADTGISFHRPTGVLYATPNADRIREITRVAGRLGHGDSAISPSPDIDTAPYRLPADLTVVREAGGAGHLDPRALLTAQLEAAVAGGARLERVEVMRWSRDAGGVRCHLRNGQSVHAERVLIAAGAYTRRLLPSLAFSVKTETTILARVEGRVGDDLRQAPALLYDIEHPLVDEMYVVPPVLYPDGECYVKMGCNTVADRYLTSEHQMTEWMTGTAIAAQHGMMDEALRTILPDLPVVDTTLKPCLVTYTEHGLPYIDRVDDLVYVAAGGNGSGAKSSDALGNLAARLVLYGEWDDALPAGGFRMATS